MTLTAAPWALDGARTPAALARLATRAAVKESGIVNPGDMKVLQLSTPGDGVRISVGGAAVENRYISNSGQTYVVECTSEEILGADDNFSGIIGNGSAQSHLIVLTIGDPQYSTSGHPWFTEAMKLELAGDATEALDFQYVRAWVIKNVPATTERIEDLGSPPTFPCYALARIDVPAGSGSITTAMIKDLRTVVNAREKTAQANTPVAVGDVLATSTNYVYETFPDNSAFSVFVPPWATKVYVNGYIYGMVLGSDGLIDAQFRVEMRKADGTFVAATPQSILREESNSLQHGANKMALMSGPIAIPAANRGTTMSFSTAAALANATAPPSGMNEKLATTTRSSVSFTLRFVEEAV